MQLRPNMSLVTGATKGADRGDVVPKDEVKAYKAGKKQDRLTKARTAFCAFNVLEAFVLLSERPRRAALMAQGAGVKASWW